MSTIRWIIGVATAVAVGVSGLIYSKLDAVELQVAANAAVLERIDEGLGDIAAAPLPLTLSPTVEAGSSNSDTPQTNAFSDWIGVSLSAENSARLLNAWFNANYQVDVRTAGSPTDSGPNLASVYVRALLDALPDDIDPASREAIAEGLLKDDAWIFVPSDNVAQ